ncbi:hypothetical protein F7725_009978 [Dissostichus mawsoni]|uniref:Sideroflexin-1 n=1 Tax=Dissostichus mawsoni TaxID=36200 RepID=A0A7J5XMI7_DISMA|nr:hypothetical protein F7725_009978 [Dissostichus mawsoni]
MAAELSTAINIKEPRWDQSTFAGRAKHFFTVTDPRNILLTNEQLANSHKVITDYRKGIVSPGLTEDELWRAKYVFDSAFHPDTGEKMILIGRMSAQVPMNMTITGCMMTFYKTTPAVLLWQWINQSFNAIVNYTNRSGDAPLTFPCDVTVDSSVHSQLGTAYVSATTGAVATALGLNALTKHISPLIGRFVPFAAVAAANCINIPLMRQRELKHGIPITDENDNRLGESTNAAKQAISQVVVSRILMASPGMAIPPFLMNHLEKKAFLRKFPWMSAPIQVGLVGFCLVFATPLCCALFPQKSVYVFDPLTPAFLPFFPQLYISQPPGARAAGENPGQQPRSGEGLLQQGAMSVQPPHPNTAIAQLQAQSSPLGQPLLIQCAKVKFVSPHFQYSDGYLGTTSLSVSL